MRNRCRTFFHFCEAIYLAVDAKRKGIRHIHAHFEINSATVALVMSEMLDISFSFTAHNNFYTDQLILRAKLKKARFVIAISEHCREFLLKLLPEDQKLKDKTYVVHCGVSPADFTPAAREGAYEKPLIFSISQLAERKGYCYLVEACQILAQAGQDFHCIIAGDGPELPVLEQLIAGYQLQDKVHLVGRVFQEELTSYLCQARLFVLPCVTARNGDRDGIPVALMEAMAMEIPVISTYVSGIPELIDHRESGLLVSEKDAAALADAIQLLLEDTELRARLGKNGRQKVVRDFNIHKSGAELGLLFEKYVSTDNRTLRQMSRWQRLG